MKVEFKIIIKEHIGKVGEDVWAEKVGIVAIEASKDSIDTIIEAIQAVPNVEIR